MSEDRIDALETRVMQAQADIGAAAVVRDIMASELREEIKQVQGEVDSLKSAQVKFAVSGEGRAIRAVDVQAGNAGPELVDIAKAQGTAALGDFITEVSQVRHTYESIAREDPSVSALPTLEYYDAPVLACPPDQLTADDLGEIMQPIVGMFMDIRTGETVQFSADGRAAYSIGSPLPPLKDRLIAISKRKVKAAEDAARAQDERAKAAVELGAELKRALNLDAGADAQMTGEAVLDVMAPRVEAAVRTALNNAFPDPAFNDFHDVSEWKQDDITESALKALRGETLKDDL